MPRSLVALVAMLFALVVPLVPAAPASAAVGAGWLYGGMYTDSITTSGDADTLAHEYNRVGAWAGKRQTFAGTFVGLGDASWTVVQLDRAWRAQSTPVVNIETTATGADLQRQAQAWAEKIAPWFHAAPDRSALIAPLAEMNGDWTAWGCNPARFKESYRIIRDAVRAQGLDETRVRWVFAPNGYTSPGCGSMGDYYPGADITDLVGFSSYNYGAANWDRAYWGPDKVFGPWLAELRRFAGDKPFLVTQTGTAPGAGKDQWLRDTWAYLAADANVVGLVYFNLDKRWAGGNEQDWRIWYGDRGDPGFRDAMAAGHTRYDWPLRGWFQPGPLQVGAQPAAPSPVTRVAGTDRTTTAVALSRSTFDAASAVVIARSGAYPDALAGAPLAAELGGPILLTSSGRLDPPVRDEIRRLGARSAVLLGGSGALSPAVEDELRALGLTVERIAGKDRFATAASIAEEVGGRAAYVVEGGSPDPGRGWPDAVSVAALAAHQRRPILLVTTHGLPEETRAALDELEVRDAVVVGGTAAVSQQVQDSIAHMGVDVRRVAGRSRYETSAAVAALAVEAGLRADRTWLATGRNWPDALAAAPVVARDGGAMLLVDGVSLGGSPATRTWLVERGPFETVPLVGGAGAISAAAESEIRAVARLR